MLSTETFAAPGASSPLPVSRDLLALVDPELRAIARRMLATNGEFPPLSEKSLPTLRSALSAPPQRQPLPQVTVAQRRVPGPRGAPEVAIYIINAHPGAAQPGILHTHSGGFVAGSAQSNIRGLQDIATDLDCVVVTVEYRLAPETRYSGSVEDNYAALKWMHAHAAELGVEPRHIALLGESAGGGHAALLAIRARDRGEVPILFQALIEPMLDDRTGSSRAVPWHIGKLVWTAESNRFGWWSFLGQEPGNRSVPPDAVPARVTNLAGLPATFIGVGSLDLFVDEDVEYARRLIEAGVPTELLVAPGAFHGSHDIGSDSSISKRFNNAKVDALRRAFADSARAENY